MKTVLMIGALMVAMASCGVKEGTNDAGGGSSATNSAQRSDPNPPGGWADGGRSRATEPEKAAMTPEQQAIAAAGTQTKWAEEDISWTLPKGWKKLKIVDRLFKFGPSDDTFIHATVLEVAAAFDAASSLRSTYDGAVEKVEAGEYEKARMLEIDGVRGVEWIEATGAGQNDPRRHQWIAFRKYNGKAQQLNVILAAPGPDFDEHRDEFAAVMYSMKIAR